MENIYDDCRLVDWVEGMTIEDIGLDKLKKGEGVSVACPVMKDRKTCHDMVKEYAIKCCWNFVMSEEGWRSVAIKRKEVIPYPVREMHKGDIEYMVRILPIGKPYFLAHKDYKTVWGIIDKATGTYKRKSFKIEKFKQGMYVCRLT